MKKTLIRVEDLFVFTFAAAIARQALWLHPGTAIPLAFAATAGLAAVLVVRRSAEARPPAPRVFWMVVALPVLGIWALRVPYPDVGYDVLNYHLMHGERALFGPLFPPGDFYPYFFPDLNPTGDMVTASFRALLGYRLGTIASPLALVWAGEVLWRLLAPVVKDERARAGAVLLVVAAEGTLLEASGYMVDLLALPVLLEATRLAAEGGQDRSTVMKRSAVLGLLLGTSVALKLTNLVFALPVGLVALARWFGPRAARPGVAALAGALSAGALSFAAPIAPHALLLAWKTGNPVFPYFNSVFASPYFPEWNIKDGRWGPESALQALSWPLLSVFRHGRLGEIERTTGRLALGWVSAFAVLIRFPRDGRLRAISSIVLLGGVLWSFGTGYHRYGLFSELLGGALVVLLAAKLAGLSAGAESGPPTPMPGRLSRAAAALLILAAAAQSGVGAAFAVRSDWSGRPTILHSLSESVRESRLLFRDRDFGAFLSAGEWKAIPEDALWVDVMPKVNGFMTLLDRDAPMIGLQIEALLVPEPNRKLLDAALAANRERTAVSLAYEGEEVEAESMLARFGFAVTRRTPLSLPFYSRERRIDLVLLELAPPPPVVASSRTAAASPSRIESPLRGNMDRPLNGSEVRGDLVVWGWAREPGEDLLVSVLVGGTEVLPRSFRRVPRPDVVAVFPEMGDCTRAGYRLVVPRPAAAPRELEVSVVVRSRDGRTRHLPGATVRWSDASATEEPTPR